MGLVSGLLGLPLAPVRGVVWLARQIEDQAEQQYYDRARNGGALPAEAARRAAEQIVSLTGRELESVVSIERRDDGWRIGVEVVETRRIPDSADILAVFEADVDEHGDLHGYRRTGRHSR